jgi:uncharacterized tellurite resistance protein B-like protein
MKRADTDLGWRDVPASERLDYLIVVASLVAADHEVSDAELAPLEEMCQELEVAGAERDAVLAIAREPDPAVVDASLARIRQDIALRVRLLTDAITIVLADGKIGPHESEMIARLGAALETAPAQINLIARYVDASVLGHTDQPSLARALAEGVAVAERHLHPPGVIRRMFERFRRDDR